MSNKGLMRNVSGLRRLINKGTKIMYSGNFQAAHSCGQLHNFVIFVLSVISTISTAIS